MCAGATLALICRDVPMNDDQGDSLSAVRLKNRSNMLNE